MAHSHRHENRNDLVGEHPFGDAGQLIFAVSFSIVWILDSFVLHWTTMLNQYVPGWLQIALGCALLLLSGYMAISSIRIVFGEQRDPPCVIKVGLFAHVRHPMYVSEVLLYVGLFLLSLSLAALAVGIGAIFFLRTICRHEERLLLERYGDEYRDYMRDVPMWLPRLRRRGT